MSEIPFKKEFDYLNKNPYALFVVSDEDFENYINFDDSLLDFDDLDKYNVM